MTGEHIDDTNLEAALRAAELDRGEEDTLGRVHARVEEHVSGSNITGPGWGWSHRITVFAAVAVPVAAAAAIAAILLLGHGPSATKIVQPAGSPKPNASAAPPATPSPAAAPQTVIVESSSPANAVGPVTVHWVTTSGTELASRQLPSNEAILGAGGNHVLIYRSDGHVLDLNMDGTSQDVGSGMPASTAPGPASVPVRALVSPDGTQWIWGQIVTQSGNGITSTITLGGIGAGPRVVARAVEAYRALEPYQWALANPLISHGAVGVGGYILFNIANGQVEQLDLATGKQTPVGTASSGAVDLAGNGATAYTEGGGAQGTQKTLTVNGPGQRGLSANLPATGQAGGLMFDPGSNHLVFATSPASGPPHEHFETDVLDLNSGARTKLGPADLRPATWLSDGRLVEFRTSSDGDGAPGTYLVSLDGSAAKISGYSQVMGTVQLSLPVAAHCATSDLEVVSTQASGAAGTITEVFEIRNKSQAACVLKGYFGVAAENAAGQISVVATRSTIIAAGVSHDPHDVVMLAGTAPLRRAVGPANNATPGHAYFYVSYGHGCSGGAASGADRWQLIPPDQTGSLVVASQDRTFCAPVVTPVDDTPALLSH
jgi:hypothetical protein